MSQTAACTSDSPRWQTCWRRRIGVAGVVRTLLPFALVCGLLSGCLQLWQQFNAHQPDGFSSLHITLLSSLLTLAVALLAAQRLPTLHRTLQSPILPLDEHRLAGMSPLVVFGLLLSVNGVFALQLQQYGWHPLIGSERSALHQQHLLMFISLQLPLILALLLPGFIALKRDLEDAAAVLGASRWQYWRHIGLPLLRPAFMLVFTIVAANALVLAATTYCLLAG